MSLPNPAMTFTPFDPLTASQLNDFVENNEALAGGTGFDTGAIATAKILASNVTPAKLASEVRWWEELGRVTAGGTVSSLSLTPITAKKHLMISLSILATGGTVGLAIRFNNDSASNYAYRASNDGAADGTAASATLISVNNNLITVPQLATLNVTNISNAEKLVTEFGMGQNTAGAGNIPPRRELFGKWVNTSAQITRVDAIQNAGTGNFATGSELIVYGHD